MDHGQRVASPHVLSRLTAKEVMTAPPLTLLERILRSSEGWK